ncbi:PREDICTED: UDP-glycosyltransferase 85A1-like isoform X2 [Tarenaya hassleriana]|uniref:UDP-glycosyltransferase 85A1-like isoform X1 n=1 Tax=Tarenaya hassleriana TaxID=28532 RepID=UPI00053CA801|nr:PREDICTED: UDP-glycosyltransferase 85A1-like isoform X1 [Tarenaya hassleriana]XP_010535409.1 PREDICTED: UDP-glycosyltransferase 85A1-like isoform X2 [Tarenaya hassleriana]
MGKHADSGSQKPHAVCIPYPAQGHINPMMKVAKLLHARGFHVTFVNTEFNHRRFLRSRGPHALDGLRSFRFETIPDGLPESDLDATQDIPALCQSTMKNCLSPFRELLQRLNATGGDIPSVSCVVYDGAMSFAVDAAAEFGIPAVMLWTFSASVSMLYFYYRQLIQKGLIPLKDESYMTNGYLDTEIEWIPSIRNIRVKDLPGLFSTTKLEHDPILQFVLHAMDRVKLASAIVINTFHDLEHDVILSLQSLLPPVYPVGPLHLLVNRTIDNDSEIRRLGSNLWKEDTECLKWLDTKAPRSVIYVNFGSITVMSEKQLVEFAWGLAGSGKEFLWVIRPDLLGGETAVVPPEFVAETAERGLLASWCPQEKVLSHPAIGGFLTHCGWNSTLESISGGVPVICWPFFADQSTNRRFCCDEWGMGMEIGSDAKREEVEAVVRELMDGEKGNKMRETMEKLRRLAEAATTPPSGSSFVNFETVVDKVLRRRV